MTVHGGFGKTVEKRLGPPNPRMEHGLLTSVPEEVGDTDRRGRGLLRIVLLQSLLVYALPRLERGLRVARQIGGGCEGGQLILGQGRRRIDLREEFVGFLPGLTFQRISGPVLQFLRAWSRLCAQSGSPRVSCSRATSHHGATVARRCSAPAPQHPGAEPKAVLFLTLPLGRCHDFRP